MADAAVVAVPAVAPVVVMVEVVMVEVVMVEVVMVEVVKAARPQKCSPSLRKIPPPAKKP